MPTIFECSGKLPAMTIAAVIGACRHMTTTWDAVQQRFAERAQPSRSDRPRRYLLSGLLTCERCASRLVVTSKPPRYTCGTFLYGGRAACPVDATARLDAVESAILQPIKSELLSPEAVEKFCNLIQEWHRRENEELTRGSSNNG